MSKPKTSDTELCDSTHEHPAGSWLMCDRKGQHDTHGGTEPNGRRVTWRDPDAPSNGGT